MGNPEATPIAAKGQTGPTVIDHRPSDQPMKVLIAGILLMGSISLFIAWVLANAYQHP
jgi:hypothetical protein